MYLSSLKYRSSSFSKARSSFRLRRSTTVAASFVPPLSKHCKQAHELKPVFQPQVIPKEKGLPAHILLSVSEWTPNTQISPAGPKKNQLCISAMLSDSPVQCNVSVQDFLRHLRSTTLTKDSHLPNKLKKLQNSRMKQIVAIAVSNKGINDWFQNVIPNNIFYQMLILQFNTLNC